MHSLGNGITKMISQGIGSNLNIILGLVTLLVERETVQLQDDTKPPIALCHSHQTWQTRDDMPLRLEYRYIIKSR
jgi:hypothetical protein